VRLLAPAVVGLALLLAAPVRADDHCTDADADGDQAPPCGGDCDDNDAAVSSLSEEVCGNAVDEDCSGLFDDLDADADGWIAEPCGGRDCFDQSAAIGPDQPEDCRSAFDEDCDGLVAADDPDCGGDGDDDDSATAPEPSAGCDATWDGSTLRYGLVLLLPISALRRRRSH